MAKMKELALVLLGGATAGMAFDKAAARLRLSRAKHRSLAGHARMGKRLAGLMPAYAFDEKRFFRADDAPAPVEAQRRAAFDAMAERYRARYPRTREASAELRPALPDLAFTSSYRVPFPFSPLVRERLAAGAMLAASEGVMLTDLDGNAFYDLTGSYGVNLLGTDTYKRLIEEGARTAAALGPVLGGLHPVVADNVRRLRAISGLDAVSFHMSGTEAVMQAVRLARYHTGRTHLVRFAGAYHGWWGDVQPGIGNPIPADHTYTLADMSERSLKVLATRKNIACVLVNPLQALHPNRQAPGNSSLVAGRRSTGADREDYARWLARRTQVCRKAGIVLIVDEVFTGFRLAPRGACEYFGVQPDMITYGKTLGGGLPVGVLCGTAALMKRYREERPADICFARGTFNAHPYVMGAMDAFLRHMETADGRALYDGLDARWAARARALNDRLEEAGVPVRVSALGTIWTVNYTQPSRYHWMLQFYLREQGLALSWVGTGRLVFNLAYTDADFAEVVDRFVAAARAMAADGWWWSAGDSESAAKALRRRLIGEMLGRRRGFFSPAVSPHPRRPSVQQLAGKLGRRAAIEARVVERIGDDLGRPDKAGLHVADEEQVHRAEQQAPDPQHQPHQAKAARIVHRPGGLRENAEERRVGQQRHRAQQPQPHQHDLAGEVVADLDLFLVRVGGAVDVIVVARLEEEVACLPAGHRHTPGQQRGQRGIAPQQDVGDHERHRADEVQALVDQAVVVVAVIVPALFPQLFEESVYFGSRC